MSIIYADTETFSETPISHGTYAYAADAEVMLFAYAIDDSPVHVIDLTEPGAFESYEWLELVNELNDPANTIVFQNSMFDRTVIREALGIDIPAERIHDTMVQALTHGLPGKLERLCEVFKLTDEQAKDKRGRELINLFCKPRPKNMKLRRATRETNPAEWAQFIEYAASDIVSMRVLHGKMPKWNYSGRELALWYLDQRINDRGFNVDRELAQGAIDAVALEQGSLAADTLRITYGEVESAAKRDQLLKHILEYYDVHLPDMRADTLERRLNDETLPDGVRLLIGIRLQASTVSTKKYKTLLNTVSPDGRLRGTMQFSGAARTARWAHKLFQPGNMPRPDMKNADIEFGIETVKAGCADLLHDNVMKLLSNAVRGCIISSPGKKLVVSDLSNIEGRFAAWLAGEEWKLQAFRDYDTIIGHDEKGKPIRKGHDLYILSYCRAFNVQPGSFDPKTVEGNLKRQIGKVIELMLQYEGGVGAFLTGAATYDIDLEAMADAAWDSIPTAILKEAEKAWVWASQKKRTFGLSKKVYVVCDALKRLWREAHPEISSYWAELDNAAKAAVIHKGRTFVARRIKFRCDGAWLRMQLPSGRYVCYSSPKVERDKLTYMGMSPYSRQWKRQGTYGGKTFENACQAGARDVLAWNMPSIEDAGYEILLTVHDEDVAEAPDTEEFNAAHLSALVAANPPWAGGLPLAASGFEGYRYRKD